MRRFTFGVFTMLSLMSVMLASADVHIQQPASDFDYLVAADPSKHIHDYETEWSWDSGYHFHRCVADGDCDQPQGEKRQCEENSGITIRAATINEDGSRIFLCRVCGHQLRTEVVPRIQSAVNNDDTPDAGEEEQEVQIEFVDVTDESVFCDAIRYVAKRAIMNGIDVQKFGAQKYMTRGMLVDSLYRLAASPTITYSGLFVDVSADHEYADAIEWCASKNIITGYYDSTFRATDNLTRQQLCTLLYRYAEYAGLDTDGRIDLSDFTDGNKVSEYSLDAMSWCVANKIIQGNNGFLMPTGTATRGQMAAILQRFCVAFDA